MNSAKASERQEGSGLKGEAWRAREAQPGKVGEVLKGERCVKTRFRECAVKKPGRPEQRRGSVEESWKGQELSAFAGQETLGRQEPDRNETHHMFCEICKTSKV